MKGLTVTCQTWFPAKPSVEYFQDVLKDVFYFVDSPEMPDDWRNFEGLISFENADNDVFGHAGVYIRFKNKHADNTWRKAIIEKLEYENVVIQSY